MTQITSITAPLLRWYHAHRRVLPFREDPTPYHVWVSEIMLQQTRVSAALPYYERFMAELPTVQALAACGEERLQKLWQGLGYYSRARNLQKAACIVVEEYDGELPASYEKLLRLPGIGEYTAGAIASIAFGLPHVAVDGNVLRVFSRLLACEEDITLPKTKQALAAEAQRHMPKNAPSDYNQALMELGALVCLPGTPKCEGCPLREQCTGFAAGIAPTLPRKTAKPPKKQVPVCIFVVHSPRGVLLQQRPAKGLLAGLWQPPLFEGSFTKAQAQQKLEQLLPGIVLGNALPKATHVFTHRIWLLYGWQAAADINHAAPEGCVWVTPQMLQNQYAVPSAFAAYLPLMSTGGGEE